MLPSFAKETITVIRAPEITDRGATYRDWNAAAEHPVTGCLTEPGGSSEGEGETVTTDYTVLAPYEADVLETDRVRIPSGTFKVVGEPARQPSPSGRLSSTLIKLEKFKG